MVTSLFKKLNLIVVGIITGYIVVAAYGAWLYVDRPATQTSVQAEQKQTNVQKKPTQQNTLVKETHIFGTPQDKVKEAKNTKYQLKGIVVNGSDNGIAIISVNGKDQFLQQGDKIENGTVIKKIEKERVLIMKNGETMYLSIFKEFKPRPYIAQEDLKKKDSSPQRAKFSREEMMERYKNMDPETLRERFRQGFGGLNGTEGGAGFERMQEMMERRQGLLGGDAEFGNGAVGRDAQRPGIRSFRDIRR